MNNQQLTSAVTELKARVTALESPQEDNTTIVVSDQSDLLKRVAELEANYQALLRVLVPKCHFCGELSQGSKVRITRGRTAEDVHACGRCKQERLAVA